MLLVILKAKNTFGTFYEKEFKKQVKTSLELKNQ